MRLQLRKKAACDYSLWVTVMRDGDEHEPPEDPRGVVYLRDKTQHQPANHTLAPPCSLKIVFSCTAVG